MFVKVYVYEMSAGMVPVSYMEGPKMQWRMKSMKKENQLSANCFYGIDKDSIFPWGCCKE